MDRAIGAEQVFVMMTLFGKDGSPKLLPACTYPLTGVGCVDRLYSDVATFALGPGGAHGPGHLRAVLRRPRGPGRQG